MFRAGATLSPSFKRAGQTAKFEVCVLPEICSELCGSWQHSSWAEGARMSSGSRLPEAWAQAKCLFVHLQEFWLYSHYSITSGSLNCKNNDMLWKMSQTSIIQHWDNSWELVVPSCPHLKLCLSLSSYYISLCLFLQVCQQPWSAVFQGRVRKRIKRWLVVGKTRLTCSLQFCALGWAQCPVGRRIWRKEVYGVTIIRHRFLLH